MMAPDEVSDSTIGPRVAANAHDDHHAHEVVFDAVEYFTDATFDDLRALQDCGWGGDYPADDVVYRCVESAPDLATMLAYCRREGTGFECAVDPASAVGWLRRHRPEALGALVPPEADTPLRAFFEAEFANTEQVRREEDGDVPEDSLATAINSWEQAPDDVRASWCRLTGVAEWEVGTRLEEVESRLRLLAEFYGQAYPLASLMT